MRLADIAVYDRYEQLSMLVEVRPIKDTSASWAAEVRSLVIEIADDFNPRYFLLVARDWMYLWTSAKPVDAAPDLIMPTEEILAPYLQEIGESANSIIYSVFDLVVGNWLDDVTRGWERSGVELLDRADLRKDIRNGRIRYSRAA